LKKLWVVFLAVAALSSSGIILAPSTQAGEDVKDAHVIAYYFHGSFRCPTCRKLEQYSREAVETNFKDALASGKLEFKVINVEDKENEHFVNDYQLYAKSLVISLIENGKEVKSKNLTKIWDYAGNKQMFFNYVTSEICDFLKGS